jgi:hypothetical protein
MGWFGLDMDYLQVYVERAGSPISGEWLATDTVVGVILYIVVGAVMFSLFSMGLRRRYSLRMLLMLTTFVAVSLGILVIIFR